MMRVLVVRLGALGDLVHTLPLAAALRDAHPDARIDWLVDARHRALLDLVPVITERFSLNTRSWTGPSAPLAVIRRLRLASYDIAFDAQGLIKSALLARLSGAARVVGFARAHLREPAASLFYTESVDPGGATHVIDKTLTLLQAIGIEPPRMGAGAATAAKRPNAVATGEQDRAAERSREGLSGDRRPGEPRLEREREVRERSGDDRSEEERRAKALRGFPLDARSSPAPACTREVLGLIRDAHDARDARDGRDGRDESDAPFVLLNPGAAWPNKRWPPERFAALAREIQARHGLRSAVLWGPGEETLAAQIARASGGAAEMAPATGLVDVLALAREARLLVSGDTGPTHLAAAVGTPIVGIYGPTDPARNGPWHPDDICVSRFTACACHHQRRCRIANWCLAEIAVTDVMAAVDRRLATSSPRATTAPPTSHA